ncbi:hypothetical protein [Azospirillum sp. TSO35-2]|uniref:hypothetical protein n=1 Tax=Azospirillum sp. TSO35-2 TaxID=716796 RepID=UPI000D60CA3B|nr:hypothetical protein [Azospirillum sp. TSO35-2]PWC39351.1 hypothetical protein TSO352_04030 [Azospirillum sp. TSO35-2]
MTCQPSVDGFMRVASSSEIPNHASTTGTVGERRPAIPASSRTLRRIGTTLKSPVHCRRIMPMVTRPAGRTRVPTTTVPPCPSSPTSGTTVPGGMTVRV